MIYFDSQQFISYLYSMGVYNIVLPFLLVFTIVFAFLQKTKILGVQKNSKRPQAKFNAVIALIMGILAVQQQWLTDMFQVALPEVAVTIIGILMFFILISMFTGGSVGIPKSGFIKWIIMIFAVGSVGYYFLSQIYGYFPDLSFITDNIQTIIIIGVFALIIFFIVGEDNPDKKYPYGGKDYNKKDYNNHMWNDFLSPHDRDHPYDNYVIPKNK